MNFGPLEVREELENLGMEEGGGVGDEWAGGETVAPEIIGYDIVSCCRKF